MLLHKKEFFGNGFFTADHVTVCGLLVLFLCYFGLYIRTHVETVALLSKLLRSEASYRGQGDRECHEAFSDDIDIQGESIRKCYMN